MQVRLALPQPCAAVVGNSVAAVEEEVEAAEAVAAALLTIAPSTTWSQRIRTLAASATTKTFHPWDRQTASSKVDLWAVGSRATAPTCRIIISGCDEH